MDTSRSFDSVSPVCPGDSRTPSMQLSTPCVCALPHVSTVYYGLGGCNRVKPFRARIRTRLRSIHQCNDKPERRHVERGGVGPAEFPAALIQCSQQSAEQTRLGEAGVIADLLYRSAQGVRHGRAHIKPRYAPQLVLKLGERHDLCHGGADRYSIPFIGQTSIAGPEVM